MAENEKGRKKRLEEGIKGCCMFITQKMTILKKKKKKMPMQMDLKHTQKHKCDDVCDGKRKWVN